MAFLSIRRNRPAWNRPSAPSIVTGVPSSPWWSCHLKIIPGMFHQLTSYENFKLKLCHYNDVIMSAMASQITSLTIVYSNVLRRKSKKTSKLRVIGICAGIHRWPVNSPHKGPVTRKMFQFDDVIMVRVPRAILLRFADITVKSLPLHENRLPVGFNCRYLVINGLQWPNLMIGYSLRWRHIGNNGI